MKKILVDTEGNITDICNAGDEFEVYEGPGATIKWMDADDNVQEDDCVRNGEVISSWNFGASTAAKAGIERVIKYGQLGDQLDMIYKDMKNGTTDWVDHIDAVKVAVGSPSVLPDDDIQDYVPRAEPEWEII